MKLHHYLSPKSIMFVDGVLDKKNLLYELLEHMYESTNLRHEKVPLDEACSAVLDREKEQSTGLGRGFAFPHARLQNLSGAYTLLAVSRKGIDFDSMDHQPAHFIVLSLVPRLDPAILLTTRAAIVKAFNRNEIQARVLSAHGPMEIWKLIEEQDIDLNRQLTARDIMRPPVARISPGMTLYEAARELHMHHIDSLPVIENDKFLCDISCHDLFSYKLPKFFENLQTISFVRNMNPFEKLFQADTSSTVSNLEIDREPPLIAPDATLIEIIFEMTVKNRSTLYVVENGTLLGVIDRYNIIDQILLSRFSGVEE